MANNHPVAPPSGFRHGGKTYKPGQRLPKKYARVVEDGKVSQDPARGIADAPPNFGRDMLPQILTFSGRHSTFSQVYRNPDIAYSQGPEQARIMRNDCAIMECLEARQRGTALLNWHIEPEDKKDDRQRQMADDLTDILQATPDFTEYRRNLLEAIWYGRYANQHAYGFRNIKGKKRIVVKRWSPINGDKLVFRYDDGTGKHSGDEVGIKVGLSYGRHDAIAGDRKIEMTDQGPAYFLEPWERARIALHRHIIEDGVYEDALSAGRIHGVGVRDRIYWCWFQKQQTMAHLMEVIERTGSGFTIYYYPAHNPSAKTEMEEMARNQNYQNAIVMPRTPGDAAMDGYGIERIEPSSAGIDALKATVHEFFGWQIKRYIIGQVLSSEAESTGMGSEVANLHQETMSAIIKYDAVKLEETMTRELLRHLQDFNPEFAWARDINFRFVIDTESANAEKKLAAVKSAFEMGLRIKATDVADMVGISMPSEDDEVLQNPQMAPQGGMPGGMPGQPGAEGIQASDAFGPAMGDEGQDEGGGEPGPDDEPDAPKGPVQYAALGSPSRWKTRHNVGETKTVQGHTYVLNQHHRWELQDKEAAAAAQADTIDANAATPDDDEGGFVKLPDHPPEDGDDHAQRHSHVSSALGGLDEQAGGLIRAFHEHPDYKGGGEVASQKLDPDHAAKLHSWLGQSAAKGDGPPIIMPDGTKLKSSHVGGGIAVDFGDGRTGFASEAGSFVVGKDGNANYTSKTGIVKSAMGGKPMLKSPGDQGGPQQPQNGQNPAQGPQNGPVITGTGQGAPNAAAPPPQANAAPQAGPAGPATPSASQTDTAPAWSPADAKPADPAKKPGQAPAPVENPHRQNAENAHAEWQEAVKGMDAAGKNGADAKDLAAWSRYVTHKRKVFREYELAAKHHDKNNKPGKGPPTGPKGETDDERILREKFGIGTKTPVAQGVDPTRPRLGSPEDIAAARQPREDDHAHHKALHETLSQAAANEPDDAKAASLAAQAVHHEALAKHHSAAVHGPEVKAAMADAHKQLSGHSPAVHSAIQAAHEALHKSGLAEAPTGQGGYVPPSDEALAKLGTLGQKSAKPTGDEPDALKKAAKYHLKSHGLEYHDANTDAIHEAIDRGHIKSKDDLVNVMKAAKGIKEKGSLLGGWKKRHGELQKALAGADDKGRRAIETELQRHEKLNPEEDSTLAVKEALRRKMGRKERAPTVKPETMLAEGAKKHGIEPEEYADLADHVWQTEGMNSPNRKPEGYAEGVRALRQHTGIKSAAAAQNDDEKELSDETYMVFRDHPELGVSPDASPQEIEDAAWEILKSEDDGGTGIPSKNSPEYWAFADDAIRQIKEYEAANPPAAEDENVPFAARWRDGYEAKIYAKKPLKSTKGQTSMFGTTHGIEGAGPAPHYDEKRHSRGPGSQFRHIGPDDSKGQKKIGWDESQHPREAAGGEKGGQFTAAHHAVSKRFGIPPEAVKSVLETHPDELAKRDSYFPPSSGRDEAVGPTLDYEQHPLGTAKIDSSRHKTGDTDNAPVDYLREFDPHSLKLSEHEDGIRHAGSTEKYVEWLKAGHKPPPISVYDSSNGNGDLVSGNRRRTLAAQMANAGPITGWHGVENKETGLPLKYGDVKNAHAEAEGKKGAPFSLTRPGEYQPPKAPPEEKPKASGGKQEALFHGLGDAPGQTKLFEGMDKGGGQEKAEEKTQASSPVNTPDVDEPKPKPVDPALWTTRKRKSSFGEAGPQGDEYQLTQTGSTRAFNIANRTKLTEDDYHGLEVLGGGIEMPIEEKIGSKIALRNQGHHDAWFRLASIGLVESVLPGEGKARSYKITDKGSKFLDEGYAEQERLLDRVKKSDPDGILSKSWSADDTDDGPAPSPAVPKGPEPKGDGGAAKPEGDKPEAAAKWDDYDPSLEKSLAKRWKNAWWGKYKDDPELAKLSDRELAAKRNKQKYANDLTEAEKEIEAQVYREQDRRAQRKKLGGNKELAGKYAEVEAAGKWKDGRQFPKDGDKVYSTIPGMFGMPSRVEGIARKGADGRYHVKITSAAGGAKTTDLDSSWNVEGDPRIAELQAEGKAKHAADSKAAEDLSASNKARREGHKAAWREAAKAAGTYNPTDIKPGDVLESPYFDMTAPDHVMRTKVHNIDERGDVYGHGEGEDESLAPGFMGTIGKAEFNRVSQAKPSNPADDAAYARHAAEMKAAGIATLPKAEWIARRDAILAKRKENLAKQSQHATMSDKDAGKFLESQKQDALGTARKNVKEHLSDSENKPAAKTPYVNGDAAKYTGKMIDGMHEVEITEGRRQGEKAVVKIGPDGKDPDEGKKAAEWKEQQEGFKRLHDAAGQPGSQSGKKKAEPAGEKTPDKPKGNPKAAEKFRTLADGLDKHIEAKFATRNENTPKRQREGQSARIDGEKMKRVQKALRSLADAHEAGTLPKDLESIKSKADIEPMLSTVLNSTGYYHIGDTGEFRDKSVKAVALRNLMEGFTSPEEKAKAEKDKQQQKIRDLEADLKFSKIPGFFPTPKPVVKKMLDAANIKPGMKVLEPSAGKGDISDIIRDEHPEADLSNVESQYSLKQLLRAKGHKLAEGSDNFLSHFGEYDRIVMNPPFENGQDREHVRHAYDQLKPGGKLVAVMAGGSTWSSDQKKPTEFRDWLASVGGESEDLPEGSFAGSDAFRQTGVSTRMVTIEKPGA